MIAKEKTRKTITISKSIEIESFFFCKEHNIRLSILVEALLLAVLWDNKDLLKIIYERKENDKSKK